VWTPGRSRSQTSVTSDYPRVLISRKRDKAAIHALPPTDTLTLSSRLGKRTQTHDSRPDGTDLLSVRSHEVVASIFWPGLTCNS
jgi:hypothetical protein